MEKRNKILKMIAVVFCFIFVFLGLILFEASNWYIKYYENVSFSQLLFLIVSPLEGTDTGFLNGFFSECLPVPCLVITTLIIGFVYMTKYKDFSINFKKIIGAFVISVCVLLFGLNSMFSKMKIEEFVEQSNVVTDLYETYYIDPKDVKYSFPEKRRNLIYIFMESMEATYQSKDTGGISDVDYTPELTKLQKENLIFNTDNTNGNGFYVPTLSSWTVAGIIGQTCGTPVNVDWNIKNNVIEGDYLPNATSIGDILNKAGYTQEFMCGSDISFGGRGNYLEQHGGYNIFDYNYAMENGYIPDGYGVWWGFEDEKLYTFAKSELDRLSSEEAPFNLTLLTVDTHFPNGFHCKYCEDTYDSEYSNVMNCASKRVYEFVEWCGTQPWYENTTIVIAGDHNTMDKNWFSDKDKTNYDRKAYYTIINSPIDPVRKDDRQLCSYDLFPTTLAALNIKFDSNRLAFGTNLYSNSDTIIEELGYFEFDNQTRLSSEYYTNYLFGGRDLNKELDGTGRATWDMKGGNTAVEEDLPVFFEGTYDFYTGTITYDEPVNSDEPVYQEPAPEVVPDEGENTEGGYVEEIPIDPEPQPDIPVEPVAEISE